MRRVTLRSVLGDDNVTDSYFPVEQVPFNTIEFEDIAFCVMHNSVYEMLYIYYRQHLQTKGDVLIPSGWTWLWKYTDTLLCSKIDFANYKVTFELEDLVGKAFTSFCASCDVGYILSFVEGEEIINEKVDEEVQCVPENLRYNNSNSVEDILAIKDYKPDLIDTTASCNVTYIGIDNLKGCINGSELAKKIITILQKHEGTGITGHNLFLVRKNSTIYITDYRNFIDPCTLYYPIFYDFNILKPKLMAEYTGPDIEVGSEYNKEDVLLWLEYPDGTKENIEEENLQYIKFPYNNTIKVPGENRFTIKYESAEATFIVNGVYTFVELNAVYTGPPLYVDQIVDKSYVTVSEKYINTLLTIQSDKWKFISKNKITYQHIQNGTAVFWIEAELKYSDKLPICKLLVPVAIEEPDIVKFEAHYHGIQGGVDTQEKDGTPVVTGHQYEKYAIHAHALTSRKEWIDINPSDIMVSDTVVKKKGRNFYRATFRYKDKVFSDKFEIFGYENKISRDRRFQLYLITEDGEEDVTEEYEKEFLLTNGIEELQDVESLKQYYFSVDIFNSVLDNNKKYRLIAPKETGLGYKYATEWYINKKDDSSKMTLIKVFAEGE